MTIFLVVEANKRNKTTINATKTVLAVHQNMRRAVSTTATANPTEIQSEASSPDIQKDQLRCRHYDRRSLLY